MTEAAAKMCRSCQKVKGLHEFYSRGGGKLFNHCKECDNKRRRENASKNREREREHMRVYSKRHRDKQKQYVERLETELNDQRNKNIAMTIALLSVKQLVDDPAVLISHITKFIDESVQEFGVMSGE